MAKLQLVKCTGYSLIELVISMTLGLMILASAVSLLSINAHFGNQQLQQDFLHSELASIALRIGNEISRAGFCFDCSFQNPFQLKDSENKTSAILIDDSSTAVEGKCIRFAYNHDKREKPSSITKDDARGFRLGKNAEGKAVIEIYENRNGLLNWHCSKATGYAGYWQDMTIDNLVIEKFLVERTSSSAANYQVQTVTLKIAASIKGNREIKEQLSLIISVPNVDG